MVASSQASSSRAAPTEGVWGKRLRTAFDKSIVISDYAAGYANAVSHKVGGESFWPKSNDMPLEMEKCERILRSFTVEGIPQKEEKEEKVQDGKGNWITKKRKVLRKIPPAAIKNAKAIAIYSSMRSGITFGGGGGAGLVLARLPDGTWSAPAAITPNNMSVGLLIGIDFLDVVLLINSEKALEGFMSHKFTIGAETGLTAGPYGTGFSAETGLARAPVYSYVRTRGMYAGVELMGQAFLSRFDENERAYYWPGISPRDILTGKVRMPPIAYPLHRALMDAESGVAQGGKLDTIKYDIIKMPESEVMKMLGPNSAKSTRRFVAGGSSASPSVPSTPREGDGNGRETDMVEELENKLSVREGDDDDDELVKEGEKLRLPPTPQELEMLERAGIPDEDDVRLEREERISIYNLPPPPMHADVQRHWRVRPEQALKRPTKQLVMDGPNCPEVRVAQYVRLPPSPRTSMELREDALARLQQEEDAADEGEAKNKEQAEAWVEEQAEGEEDGMLLKEVDEEEADKIMKAAAQGEDVVEMKESGQMDKLVADAKGERDDGAQENNRPEGQETNFGNQSPSHEGVEAMHNTEGAIDTNGADTGETAEKQMDQHIEEPASSSSRPSLHIDSGYNSSQVSLSDSGAPARPPRNRPPRRTKK